jgi:hypothetical protein
VRTDRGKIDGTTAVGAKTIISNHPAGFVDNENGRKALLLIGECAGFQPVIERGDRPAISG